MDARLVVILLLSVVAPGSAFGFDTDRPEVQEFIATMVDDYGYDRAAVTAAIREARRQQSIIDAMDRPAEKTLNWPEYRAIFVTDKRIRAGAKFWREHRAEIERISRETGVSDQIIVGIIGVETYYGRITGNYRVLDALATLAFDYPKRAKFFTRELQQFLLLIREEGIDPAQPTGSYAGAMGRPQFMPSSYRAYAVDSSDDGRRDIWSNWEDVIGSVANYFVEHGWQPGNEVVARATFSDDWHGRLPENTLKPSETVSSLSGQGVMFSTEMPPDHTSQLLTFEGPEDEHWVGFHNFFVITRYNRSVKYALAVHQLGQEIAIEVNGD